MRPDRRSSASSAKSAASALFALKWPARKMRSWREPSSAVRSAVAFHEQLGSGRVASHSWPGATSSSVISLSTVAAGAQARRRGPR